MLVRSIPTAQLSKSSSPQLNIHAPTLLETITYWYTLRARGDLNSGNVPDLTYIRALYSASFAYSPGYGYEASDFAYHTPDNKIPMMWVHDDKVMVEIDNLGPQQRDSQDVARVAVG